jgi:hypothetical protein
MSTHLAIQPGDLDAALRFAEALVRSSVCPQHLRGKPIDAAMIILWGAEAGIGPLQSVYGINVIQGNPDASPELMRALIARAGHKLEVPRLDDRGCEMRLTRADTGAVMEVAFTEEDAKRAGLLGKGQWKSYPKAMYLARCTSMLGRAGAADAIAGLSYTHEEVTSFAGDGTEPEPLGPSELPDPLAAEAIAAEAKELVPVPDAKRQVLDACGGDKSRALELWGSTFPDASAYVPTDELDELLAGIEAEDTELVDLDEEVAS